MILKIYLIGVIVSFLIGRYVVRLDFKNAKLKYNLGTSCFVLFISLLSWVGVLTFSIVYLIISTSNFRLKVRRFFEKDAANWM
jgi:high-affinity Fe2+/Pb2+ permease